MTPIRTILNPALFQGDMSRRGYFEGWYFKLIDGDGKTAAAVIPGVALGGTPGSQDSHAFVQFILGQQARYFKYGLDSFRADKRRFRVSIGENEFSADGIKLCLGDGAARVEGELRFHDGLPFPTGPVWPGIMGPYGFVPGMECYHGIVSIRHGISGSLFAEGSQLNFNGGTGYIEKDWGRSFPSAWVWLQANHFSDGPAFLFSVADIPWRRSSFVGFFAFLHLNGRLIRFATYTGACLVSLNEREGAIHAEIRQRDRVLAVTARPGLGGLLMAPKNGLMNTAIEETISATVEVRLLDGGRTVYEGVSACAGMERYNHETLLKRVTVK